VLTGGEHPIAVPVTPLAQTRELEVDLTKAQVPAGTYRLAARWDWDELRAGGDLIVQPLSAFEKVALTRSSINRLRARSGKQVVQVEGDDFQFVRKVSMVRKGDRYAAPVDLPFSLPLGYRRGPQTTLEMQVDTSGLAAGEYALMLYQKEDTPQTAVVRVLPDPPRLEKLPIRVHLGEESQCFVLHGRDLDRITSLEAEGMQIELNKAKPGATERTGRVRPPAGLQPGARPELRMFVRDYGEPLSVPGALEIAKPRPRITESRLAPPSGLTVTTRDGELPAGHSTSVMLRVEPADGTASIHLACGSTEKQATRVQAVAPGDLFVTFDPGQWPGSCTVSAFVETPDAGRSDPREIGRVVRVPQIESFRLTDESAGESAYVGILTGRGLELIDRTGWDPAGGQPVPGLPAPVADDPSRQTLRIRMPWPSPVPHAPLYVWLRGESAGRQTTAKY
jgi:hypothetical protein